MTNAVLYSSPLKKRYAPNPEMTPTVTPIRISFLKELSQFFSLIHSIPACNLVLSAEDIKKERT